MNAADANLVLREGRDHDRGLERPPAGPEHRPPHGDPVGLRRRRAWHDGLGGERKLTVRGEADVFVEGSRDRSRRAGALRGGLRDLLLDAVRGQTGPGLSVGHTGTCGTSTGILIYRYTAIPVHRHTRIPALVYPYTGNPNFGRSVIGCIEADVLH